MTKTGMSVKASSRMALVSFLAAGLLLAVGTPAWSDRGDRHDNRYEQKFDHRKDGRHDNRYEKKFDHRKDGRHDGRYEKRDHYRGHKVKVVRDLPRGYRKVVVNKTPYYVHEHRYYSRVHNGYALIAPPVGSVFATLPFGAVNVTIGGNFFYRSGDVYLRPAPRGYVVVDPWSRPTWHIAGTFW